jgi:hypothetical protein
MVGDRDFRVDDAMVRGRPTLRRRRDRRGVDPRPHRWTQDRPPVMARRGYRGPARLPIERAMGAALIPGRGSWECRSAGPARSSGGRLAGAAFSTRLQGSPGRRPRRRPRHSLRPLTITAAMTPTKPAPRGAETPYSMTRWTGLPRSSTSQVVRSVE